MSRRSICSIIIAIMMCVTLFSPGMGKAVTASAATTGTLIEKEGWLDYEESAYEEFELSRKSDLELTLSDSCYGNYIINVVNVDTQETLYEFEDSMYYEEAVTYNMTLEEGKYQLVISTPANRTFEYEFLLKYTYVIDHENPEFSISDTDVSLYPGEGQWLYVNVKPADYEMPEITWRSSNENVAKISELGYLTAVSPGTAVIEAEVNGETFTCNVNVNKVNFLINSSQKTLYEKQTTTLAVTPDYEGYEMPAIIWSSSNTSVAKVTQDGKVTAVSKGTAEISGAIGDETVTCTITVKAMAMNYSSATVYVKKTKQLKVNGGSGTTTWSTSNKKVATVSSSGLVKGVGKGTAYIYAKRNGKTVKCKVTVKWEPETGKVVTKNYNLSNGGNEYKKIVLSGKSTVVIKATNNAAIDDDDDDYYYDFDSLYVSFDNSSKNAIWYKSLDPGESVTKTLTRNAGTYYIYYDTDCDSDISVKITTKAQISKSKMTVARGYKRDLDAVAVKNGGTWSSSNTKIATVSSTGMVKGKKNGTCYIKYKMKTGTVLKCKVTVKSPVTCKVTYVDNVAIYNDCYVTFTNNTGKKVSYIKFNIKQYNHAGKRVYGPYDWYYLDEYIPAYSSDDDWYFWVHDNARKCKAYITKVYFTDGTTWKP